MATCELLIAGRAVGAPFECPPSVSVLDAASLAGWELPHSCRRGTCESCRAQVLEGEVSPAADADGSALLCQVRAMGNVIIEPARVERRGAMQVKRIRAKFFRAIQVAADVVRVELRFPAGVRVPFRAGQYLNVCLPSEAPRSFSMANSPRHSDGVQLHVRLLEGGLFGTRVLPGLKAGDPIEVEIPLGDFYLREELPPSVILVAGGTGFAPLQSMLEDALAKRQNTTFHLYWGARTEDGIYAIDLVHKWLSKHANLRFVGVLSDGPAQVPFRAGLVHEAVEQDFPSLKETQVYACGSPAMVGAARSAFTLKRGLSPAHFFSDAFVVTANAETPAAL